jgi:hypothetical protein
MVGILSVRFACIVGTLSVRVSVRVACIIKLNLFAW